MSTEVQQMRLDVDVPVYPWRLTATEVHLGKVWLPRCRVALAQATEVHPSPER